MIAAPSRAKARLGGGALPSGPLGPARVAKWIDFWRTRRKYQQAGLRGASRAIDPGAYKTRTGAVPDRGRGLGHMAPTYTLVGTTRDLASNGSGGSATFISLPPPLCVPQLCVPIVRYQRSHALGSCPSCEAMVRQPRSERSSRVPVSLRWSAAMLLCTGQPHAARPTPAHRPHQHGCT
jgi:hypothetical protein